MTKIIVKPFRLSESGAPVEWHIAAVTASGGAASKNARAKARAKAKAAFGTAFWTTNPPIQTEIDAAVGQA
jgi:hypothetical protein